MKQPCGRPPPLDFQTFYISNFSGYFFRHPKNGKVYLFCGDVDGRILELQGWEKIKKFEGSPLTVTMVARDKIAANLGETKKRRKQEGKNTQAEIEKLTAWESRRKDADNRKILEIQKKEETFRKNYNFDGLAALYKGLGLESEYGKKAQQVLEYRAKVLKEFQKQLMDDLNRKPYPNVLKDPDGKPLPGKISKADEKSLTIALSSGAGSVTVPWLKLPPSQWIVLGKHYLASASASEKPKREEQLNVLEKTFK